MRARGSDQLLPARRIVLDVVDHEHRAVAGDDLVVRIHLAGHLAPRLLERAIVFGRGAPRPAEDPWLVPELVGGDLGIVPRNLLPRLHEGIEVVGRAVHARAAGAVGLVNHAQAVQRVACYRQHPHAVLLRLGEGGILRSEVQRQLAVNVVLRGAVGLEVRPHDLQSYGLHEVELVAGKHARRVRAEQRLGPQAGERLGDDAQIGSTP